MRSTDHLESERLERESEDSIAHRYNRDYHEPPIMAEHSRAFVEYVARYVKAGDRVLDLGCASASLWHLFRKQLPSDISLVGVDLSPGMLEQARKQFPTGDFREGSFLRIPSGLGEFDVVIVSSAFHHISDALLPKSLAEVHRVMDEHGILVGREPLVAGRLSDRGGWLAGALMDLRHLVYRLTHTREYPEPDMGPDHHAYVAREFLNIVGKALTVVDVEFRNPASLFLARAKDENIALIAKHLDESIGHKEGQEIHYAARKNYSSPEQVIESARLALVDNKVSEEELRMFLVQVAAAARAIEGMLPSNEHPKSP
jgi:ubiquinone/menaquinone biosynthesis C-methylase UbiE